MSTPDWYRARHTETPERRRQRRQIERFISLWPWLSDFAIDPHRDAVLARLGELDRARLLEIEARIGPGATT